MDRKSLIPFISEEYLEQEISWFENKISEKSFRQNTFRSRE